MKDINVLWSDIKNAADNKGLNLQYVETNSKYFIVGIDGSFSLSCTLLKNGDSDVVDFETNYKSTSNHSIVSESMPAFASKKIDGKNLYKRIHGEKSSSIAADAEVDIDHTITYAHCKFTGGEIFGCTLGDTLKYYILDDASGTYSGTPNAILNQFGFDVEMPDDRYKNTSEYDADLYIGMVIRCKYKNNDTVAKTISMNVWLHEVV